MLELFDQLEEENEKMEDMEDMFQNLMDD